MSWLKKLGLVEGDSEEKKDSNPSPATSPNTPPSLSKETHTTAPMPVAEKQFDMSIFGAQPIASSNGQVISDPQKETAIRELFQSILDKSNIEGLDYYEFRKALLELKGMNDNSMSEVQLYRSVHVAFKTQGCDATRLIDSANFYLTTLDGEKLKIDEAIGHKKAQEIDGAKNQITQIEQENVAISEQIEQFRKKVTENQGKIFELQAKMDESARSLRDREVMVNQEYTRIVDDIRSDIQRINQYLTSSTTTNKN